MTDVALSAWPDRLLTLQDWVALPRDEVRRHVECAEGILIVAPTPVAGHQLAMTNLTEILKAALPSDLVVIADLDMMLTESPLTIRAPDITVIDRTKVSSGRPRTDAADVQLVVEIISEGSRRTDRVTKLSEYAEACIAEYWILDLAGPTTLTIHRLDAAGSYQLAGDYAGSARLTTCGVEFEIDLDELSRI